jgi:hypothetical protein
MDPILHCWLCTVREGEVREGVVGVVAAIGGGGGGGWDASFSVNLLSWCARKGGGHQMRPNMKRFRYAAQHSKVQYKKTTTTTTTTTITTTTTTTTSMLYDRELLFLVLFIV